MMPKTTNLLSNVYGTSLKRYFYSQVTMATKEVNKKKLKY